MRTDVFKEETRHNGELRRVVLLYQSAFIKQVAQGVACNGLHTVQQRCCRWLLMTRDRSEGDTLPMTHEFLSHMLGVRRSSITEVLQPLGEKGLLRNFRGKVVIQDRAGLEALACECYAKIRDEFAGLLGT